MNKLLVVVAAALLATACQERETEPREAETTVASRQASRVDPAEAERAIEELNRQWVQAIANKDAAAIAGFFADDGIAIYNGEKLDGPQAIQRDAEESFASQPNATGSFESERIVFSDDGGMAYDIGTYSGSEGADAPVEGGRYLTVWRNIDGEWKVVADIASDRPIPEEASE